MAFVVLTLVAVGWFLRVRREAPGKASVVHRPHAERRILVVANETVGGSALRAEIERRAAGEAGSRVRVVCPALNSPLRHWVSDEDPARAEARRRLDDTLSRLRAGGLEAEGEIGDSEPLQAIEDCVRVFDPDEIVISTHPEGRSNWLERGLVDAAKARFDVPITHVIVDLQTEHGPPDSGREGGLQQA